jgi:hypothetical protein
MDKLTYTAHKQLHPRRPIRYWEVHIQTNWLGGTCCIDQNNSIAILRAKYGNTVIYKSIR